MLELIAVVAGWLFTAMSAILKTPAKVIEGIIKFGVESFATVTGLDGGVWWTNVQYYLHLDFLPKDWHTAMESLLYFIPLDQALAAGTVGYGICGTIRLLRWVKSFIPTVGG